MVLDSENKVLKELHNPCSSSTTHPAPKEYSEIEDIDIDSRRTRSVASVCDSNDTAEFELPSLKAVYVGEVGHENWILNIK